MKSFLTIFLFAAVFSMYGGTLIYKGENDEKKVVSEIEIFSIDKNILFFKIGKNVKSLPFSKLLKYYDTDINVNLAFDDSTSDYGVHIREVKFPVNLRGITVRSNKKVENKIVVDYSIQMKKGANQKQVFKEPYFYLYVLSTGKNSNDFAIHTFAFPKEAKMKKMNGYNEALMLEKAFSAERSIVNPRVRYNSLLALSDNKAEINIKELGNRKIVAYYLVVWGKEDIILTKSEIFDHTCGISKNWYIFQKNVR